jgi:hypothetical protein
MGYNQTVPMSCLVAGYVKKYNLIPIKKGTTAFNCTLDKPSWNNPIVKSHTFTNNHQQYSYADICDWIDEMEQFEIIELEAAYNE